LTKEKGHVLFLKILLNFTVGKPNPEANGRYNQGDEPKN